MKDPNAQMVPGQPMAKLALMILLYQSRALYSETLCGGKTTLVKRCLCGKSQKIKGPTVTLSGGLALPNRSTSVYHWAVCI